MISAWGVDPHAAKVAISIWRADRSWTVRAVQVKGKGTERLTALLGAVDRIVEEMGDEPGLILVEQPSGKFTNLNLVYAVGAITAELGRALPGVKIETIPSASWKLEGLGGGRRDKRGVMTWARRQGYRGSDQDEADALGIGAAALRRAIHAAAALQSDAT